MVSGRSNIIDVAVQLHATTEKAIPVSDDGDEKKAKWLPRSQIEMEEGKDGIVPGQPRAYPPRRRAMSFRNDARDYRQFAKSAHGLSRLAVGYAQWASVGGRGAERDAAKAESLREDARFLLKKAREAKWRTLEAAE